MYSEGEEHRRGIMVSRGTITNISSKALLGVAASRGIDTGELLRDVGLKANTIEDPNARIPLEAVLRLSEEAHKRSGNQGIGLRAAQELPFGAYKTIDYMAASSPTLAQAAAGASRHFGLITNAFDLVIQMRGDRGVLEIGDMAGHENVPGHYGEYILASLLLRFRFTTGVNWRPREVHLAAPALGDIDEYQRFFQAPVRFGQSMNRLLLDGDVLRLPQPNADPALCEVLGWHCQRLLKGFPLEQEFIGALRQTLDQSLRAGDVSLSSTARRMAISRRGLQRRLRDSGVSYREVLDQQRRQIAIGLLRGSDVDIGDIAFLLGFSEKSSFYRWFRKWTGKTPLGYLQSVI